ncbi:MAG: glutathione S-transferase [Burkholderiales bacterium]|nr:glutathione S-transferase [Burkholderiales bacterium]
MLKIWGRTSSVNVQKVMWAVAELGLAHERVDAGLHYGIVNEPWYRAMNPNGRVPVIDDDGFVLYESNAIVRYLAARHGAGTLCPADLQVRADADRWMDWATSTMAPVMTPLFWGMIRTPPEKRDAAAIEAERLKMEEVMAILDARLADRPYLAGASLTMGDIPAGCFTYRWYALPMPHGEHPHLARWYARLAERPAFRAQVMHPLV